MMVIKAGSKLIKLLVFQLIILLIVFFCVSLCESEYLQMNNSNDEKKKLELDETKKDFFFHFDVCVYDN